MLDSAALATAFAIRAALAAFTAGPPRDTAAAAGASAFSATPFAALRPASVAERTALPLAPRAQRDRCDRMAFERAYEHRRGSRDVAGREHDRWRASSQRVHVFAHDARSEALSLRRWHAQ